MNLEPLSSLANGEQAVIRDIQGGRCIRSRLIAMGLMPGKELTVLNNIPNGPFIVQIDDTRIALGRGQADKIIVTKEQ